MKTKSIVWIVGKYLDYDVSAWEFQGVFTTEEAAISACITDRYFIGPAEINVLLPDKSVEWNGCYYPKAKLNK